MRVLFGLLALALMLCSVEAQESKGSFLPLQVEITKIPEDTAETSRASRDVAAQESMARYAWWQLLIAGIGTLVAGVGTIFLIRSVQLSRQATEAAVKATEIAKEALGAERAWMAVHSPFFALSNDGKHLEIGLNWSNDGRSPATEYRVVGNHWVVDPNDPTPVPPNYGQLSGPYSMMGPGKINTKVECDLEETVFNAIGNGSKQLFIYQLVQYRDVYNPGIQRHTEVFFLAVFSMGQKDGKRSPSLGMRNLTSHNTAS